MSDTIPDRLKHILLRKREWISLRQQQTPLGQLQKNAEQASPPRRFLQSLSYRLRQGDPAIIAEIKRASPSQGVIRADFDPVLIAKSYAQSGAACLSVLTDEDFFQGHDDHLIAARNACNLPVLRKDFMLTPYQLYESRALGADCILLIVAALDDQTLKTLYALSTELGMDTLVEVHDRSELDRALALDLSFVGINNRNLRNFETDLSTTLDLVQTSDMDCLVISESGVHNREQVQLLRNHGINTFLVGEAFMRAENPGQALRALFFEP